MPEDARTREALTHATCIQVGINVAYILGFKRPRDPP